MFRPPINRAMRVLDRSFFQKDFDVAAARIFDMQSISRIRKEIERSKDILRRRAIPPIRQDPLDATKKCLLLQPEIRHDDESTWTPILLQLAKEGSISLIPYRLHLDYDTWDARDILWAVLPEELHDDIPTGFNPVGHVAHYNLRDRYLPYKQLIGEVTIDKNSAVTTVVNKVETLGEENEFRVLDLELIAGEPNYQVEVKEAACRFQFDFSKVFWNSRLSTEHDRIAEKFKPGEAVCDVMAGVGPFAIPAARNGCFVWGNDLNPECYESMVHNIGLNNVQHLCEAFNEDAHSFIKDAAKKLWENPYTARIPIKQSRSKQATPGTHPEPTFRSIERPRLFSHYVMNLPASATNFLPDFAGLYGFLKKDDVHLTAPLPMIHCYCFGPKIEPQPGSQAAAEQAVCDELSEKLQFTIRPTDPEMEIYDVRNVAPNKSQFCATFRLPMEVAYR